MTHLTVYPDDNATHELVNTSQFDRIQSELSRQGIRMERWQTRQPVSADSSTEEVLAAFQKDIDRLVAEEGYQSYDVISMSPDHPEKESFRKMFLSEHTHTEDELRFFVRGQGLFVLHIDDKVYSVLCERGDLIGVPAGTRHWFDMGPNPDFTAIRLFNNPDGWTAHFTHNDIAGHFPHLDN